MLSAYAAWNRGAATKQHVNRTAVPAANRPAVRSTRVNITTIAAPPATRFTTVTHTAKLSPLTVISAPTTMGNIGRNANVFRASAPCGSPAAGR
jgi:hypothetical protein